MENRLYNIWKESNLFGGMHGLLYEPGLRFHSISKKVGVEISNCTC